MEKHKCCKCDEMAVWEYMPTTERDRYYCDEHVPRGCYCNLYDLTIDEPTKEELKHIAWLSFENFVKAASNDEDLMLYATKERQSDSFFFMPLDEQDRELPCCEYDYDENGFDVEEE